MKEGIYRVSGMSGAHCAKAVEEALYEVEGVHHVHVSLEEEKVEIHYEGKKNFFVWSEAVEDAGYELGE